MPMAPAAARAPGALLPRLPSRNSSSSSSFLVPSPSATATTTARLARRGVGNGAAVLLGAVPRSGRRDGWDADPSSSGGGRLVDEDMATLRRRIREARAAAAEDGIDGDSDTDALPLPAGWTELERRHHGSYVAGVRGAAGLLEALLVSARPGLGAGALALLLLSVPASLILVCAQLIQAVDSLPSAGLNGR